MPAARRGTGQEFREHQGALRRRLRRRAGPDPRGSRAQRGREDHCCPHPDDAAPTRRRSRRDRRDRRPRGTPAGPGTHRPHRPVRGCSMKPSAATRTSSTSLACTTWAPRSPRAGDRAARAVRPARCRRPGGEGLLGRHASPARHRHEPDRPALGPVPGRAHHRPRPTQPPAWWALIDELVRGGTTTLLTTQYLDEADRLADDIVVIDQGKAIARGTSEELKQQIGGELIEVIVEDPADAQSVIEVLGRHLRRSPRRRRQANGVAAVFRVEGPVPVAVRSSTPPGSPTRRGRQGGRRSTTSSSRRATPPKTAR